MSFFVTLLFGFFEEEEEGFAINPVAAQNEAFLLPIFDPLLSFRNSFTSSFFSSPSLAPEGPNPKSPPPPPSPSSCLSSGMTKTPTISSSEKDGFRILVPGEESSSEEVLGGMEGRVKDRLAGVFRGEWVAFLEFVEEWEVLELVEDFWSSSRRRFGRAAGPSST